MRQRHLVVCAALLATVACKKADTAPATTPQKAATPARPAPSTPVVRYTGFSTPESVLYDDEADVYLVSNINGTPTDEDDNGFISRLSPEGEVLELKWIDGENAKVILNAPKGLAISGNELWVSDIDMMRVFDRKTGKALGQTRIAGASFLNDIAVGPDGAIYFSDTGVKPGASGFEPTGSDAVYRFAPRKKRDAVLRRATMHEDSKMGGPNGVAVTGTNVFVVTFLTGELFTLAVGHKDAIKQKLPAGSLDGVVALPSGELLISSWEDQSVIMGMPGSVFGRVVHGVKAPADIGFDTKRNRVLVPLFMDNEVAVFDLP